MDWDLWSSSCDQVSYDGNNSEWRCDFSGSGRDAIEEDALNEESCVQVLRILITKANTEIEELEKDLLSLQNELAWTEHENWPEICCSALTERINRLDVAVSTLKSDHADDTETQLLLHSKPAETLHEIVKALQRDHCQDTDGQHLDAKILNPVVNVTELALENDSNNIDSNGITSEEGKEHYETLESSRSSGLLLELHEKISDDPENTEVEKALLLYFDLKKHLFSLPAFLNARTLKLEELLAISLVRSPDLGALSCVSDHSDGMTLSDTLDDKVTGDEDVRRSQLITTDTGQILNPFSSKGNGHIPSEVKEENTIVKENVCSDGYGFAVGIKGRTMYIRSRFGSAQQSESGNSDLDKKRCDFVPKTARRARRKESKVAPDEDFESMNMPLQVVYPKKMCFADTELSAFKGTNGNHSLQVINIEKATLNDESSALISLPGMQTKNALCNGLHPKDEEKPQVQDLKSEIAANLSKSNMSFPSKLKAQGKQKPELEACSAKEPLDSSMEVIPITFENVSTKRQRKSETCLAGAILNESMNKKITKRNVQPGQHKTEGLAIVPYDSNFSAKELDSLMEVIPITSENISTKRQRKSKTCTFGAILNESMMQPGQHETEGQTIVPYDSKFSAKEPLDSPMEVIPTTSKNVSTKRQRKLKTCTSGANESMDRKITKRAVQPGQHETEGHTVVPYDSNFSAKEPLDSPMEVVPITYENVSTKKQRKSKTCMSDVILNKSVNRKTTKRAVQPGQHETEGHSIVLYDSKFSELQKKRASMLPITSEVQNSAVNLDITNSDRVLPMDNGSQDKSKSSSLADSHNESSAINLMKLKLIDLRAMAKQYNISKYYKLAKGALVAQLVERLSRC